jgi:adenosylhomocysteine nucleosidase
MEAYALAKVCTHLHVDFHCYKYVSDDANETADTDWQENISKGEPLFYDVLREYFNFVHIQ